MGAVKLSEPWLPIHVEGWHDWIGFFGVCPKCDKWFDRKSPFSDEEPKKPTRWQFVANDTGKEHGYLIGGITYVAILEVECPYCFEIIWCHVTKDTVESIEHDWGGKPWPWEEKK